MENTFQLRFHMTLIIQFIYHLVLLMAFFVCQGTVRSITSVLIIEIKIQNKLLSGTTKILKLNGQLKIQYCLERTKWV